MASSIAISSLKAVFPKSLVDALMETYGEVKSNFYLGRLRPNEVEGGRFAEAAFRLLEYAAQKKFTPLGTRIDTERVIRDLSNTPIGSLPESIRLHIPRALRVIYDIRSKRDAAHLADGIDPNVQDATIVVACCDWTMAEIVRLYHGVSPELAHEIVDDLVTRKAPVVQEFGEFLKTLRPDFGLNKRILVLLYQRGGRGATYSELASWVRPSQVKSLRSNLWKLVYDRDFLVELDGIFKLTRTGQIEVERRRLLEPG